MKKSVARFYIDKILARIPPGLRKIIENMSWLMFDRAVRLGIGLFVGVWIARYLGPAQYGSFNFALSFVAIFTTISTLGLDMIVVREIVHDKEDAHEVLGTTLALRIGGAVIALLVTVATIRLIQPHDKEVQLLVSILSLGLLFQTFDTIDLFFQSQVISKITVWAKNSAFLIFAAIRIALVHFKAPLWTFAAAAVGEIVLGALGLILGYRLYGGKLLAWRSRAKRARLLLQQGWPLVFSSMAVMIYMRIDMVMLKIMQGDFSVGLYAAAVKVSEVWYLIPLAIVSSVTPAIMRTKNNPVLYYAHLRKFFSIMTWTACLIGSVVALSSHFIVRILYAHAYSAAGPVLAVHIWASVFVFLSLAQSPWDISENLMELYFYRTVAGAIVNVVMNIFLIPRYAAMGAAISTVVAYAISGVFANAFDSRTRPIFYMQMRSFVPSELWAKNPDTSSDAGVPLP